MVASGTVVSNQEKINIIVRAILAMDSLDVDRVVIMPDPSHIAERVIQKLGSKLKSTIVELLELPFLIGTWKDTLKSARLMREMNFSAIVVMGGDGTNRVVAKESGHIPLIPVSTGTNNVFPRMIEGTLVGLAAATLASGAVSEAETCNRAPRLELMIDEQLADIALIDVAVVGGNDSAARAVWEPGLIREVFLTRASPNEIGLSAIGGYLPGINMKDDESLHVILGPGGFELTAPIGPGLMQRLAISEYRKFGVQEEVPLRAQTAMIALDGEREFAIHAEQNVSVRMTRHGPVVMDTDKALKLAAQRGFFCSDTYQNIAC